MDINKLGRLSLIKIPRLSSQKFVSIEGVVESYGDVCAPKYITTIDIFGSWLPKHISCRSEDITTGNSFTLLVGDERIPIACSRSEGCLLENNNSTSISTTEGESILNMKIF